MESSRKTSHQDKETVGGLKGPNPDSVLPVMVCSSRPLSHKAPEMMTLGKEMEPLDERLEL